jgi:2'-5' RNA ligase
MPTLGDSALFSIVAFPSMEASDRQWIESIRARHDPQAPRIGAHVSLVFPTILSRRTVEMQAARIVRISQPIKFVLRRAAVVEDSIGAGGHVFLLPEEGRDQIVQLHDRLYEGALQPHIRKDLPFRPHLTVASKTASDPLHELAGEINAANRSIRGFIAEIVLVEVEPGAIRPIMHFQLGGLQ